MSPNQSLFDMKTRTVRLFLSSTFRDFGEERDLLVRRVFPALRVKLKDRFVELVDVDLRWGITAEQAERGEVLPICLAEIDRARPYFIGMLGERYGWIPPFEGYAADLIERQPWLTKHQGGKSVTELEILHGVLNDRRMKGRAFFYFRSSAYARAKGGDYLPSAEDRTRQIRLKRRIRERGLLVTQYANPEALAKRIERDLWKLLDAEFPASEVPDLFERERLRHEAYALPMRRLYLGGERYQAALENLLGSEVPRIIVEGAAGGGKSALLANLFDVYRKRHPRHLVHEHYLGASADAADPYALVRRLIEFIQRATNSPEDVPRDPQKLMDSLPLWLAIASAWARKRRSWFIFVLDSLNSLTVQQDLRWWPAFLPRGITMVVSCLPGPVYDALKGKTEALPGQAKPIKWKLINVRPLSKSQSGTLLNTFLSRFNKKLPIPMVHQVVAHELASNPLFIRTLAEELRLFGVHEDLQKRLEHYLSCQTIDDLFERILERVEKDCGKKQVRTVMTAIWASRAGLIEKEILSIANLSPAIWAAMRHTFDDSLLDTNGRITFAHDYLSVAVKNRYLSASSTQVRAHQNLAQWFKGRPADARRAEEEPYQWQQAHNYTKLQRCLLDREMFEAIEETFGTQTLLSYWIVLEAKRSVDTALACRRAWNRWAAKGTGSALANSVAKLARFLINAGRIGVPALALAKEAVRRMSETRGPNHTMTLSARSALATLHTDAGRYDQSLAIQQDVLEQCKRKLGLDHSDSQSTMGNIALLLTYMGLYAQAQSIYDELLPSLRRTARVGKSGSDNFTALNNQGLLFYYQDKYSQAENCFKEAWRQCRAREDPNHPANGDMINNLANLYFKQGKVNEAISMHRQCLELWQEGLGRHNPRTASSLNNLGYILLTIGDYLSAEPLLNRAYSVYDHRLGETHPNTLLCANSLAIIYSQTGRHSRAILEFTRVLAIRQAALGPSHPQTLGTKNRLDRLLLLDPGK
jgi:tetratricopeptide (TPR) repeat protein